MTEEQSLKITPEFILDVIKRRRWYLLIPFCLTIIGGIYFVIVTPRIFEAKTLILVEGQRVPQDYVQSIVTEDTGARINTISQQILSRTNLEKIIKDFSLYDGSESRALFMEDKVRILRKRIFVNVITNRRQANAFEIHFKGQDPNKVMRVANALATSYIDENLKVRETQAVGTSDFLDAELAAMRSRLEQLEEVMKNYRKTNMGELPEQLETNLRILERLQDNLSDRQQSIRDARIRMAELKSRASSRQPSVVVIGNGQDGREGGASLDQLLAELETLNARYTEKHPDIIRIKKQIQDMEAAEKSSQASPQKSPSKRIPLELRNQIQETQREIQLTEVEIQEIATQIEVYRQRVENTPKREQELLGLRRDYQNIQTSYDSLLKRKLEADIAVNMERKQKGEQFRIVDPATVPQRPVEPNMKKVFLAVMVGGLGIGGGLSALLEFIDSSFKNPDDVENFFGMHVLTSIPTLVEPRHVIVERLNNIGSIAFAVLTLSLLSVFGLISIKGAEPLVTVLNKLVGS